MKKKYRLNNLKRPLDVPYDALGALVQKNCGLSPGTLDPEDIILMKESLDARDKNDIHYVCTVDFLYDGKLSPKARKKCTLAPDLSFIPPIPGSKTFAHSPVVVGFGPCGIFAALILAEAEAAPIVIERGAPMTERISAVSDFWQNSILNPENNVLFGEGGAGTFSDGKLTTGIKSSALRYVLETFVTAGAPADILYKQKPHIGTDILRCVVVALRKRIEAAGGQILFHTRFVDYKTDAQGNLIAVILEQKGKTLELPTEHLILAPGHSARDTFQMLRDRGVPLEQKPFSIGLRIEHPQSLIDRAQYGDTQGLPPADYKINTKATNGRGVYSFCMCPGGRVIPVASEPKHLCVNGMSLRARDSGIANAAILSDVRPSDFGGNDPLAGIAFQRHWESLAYRLGGDSYLPPNCLWRDFQEDTSSGRRVRNCLPIFAQSAILEAIPIFGRRIHGFDEADARLTAVESRSSSPVRILRDNRGQSKVPGIFPAGEGAGYAGGIASAACDGVRAALAVMGQG